MFAFKEILFTVLPPPPSSYFIAKQYLRYSDFQGWIKRKLAYVFCPSYSPLPGNSTFVKVMQIVTNSCQFCYASISSCFWGTWLFLWAPSPLRQASMTPLAWC